MKLKNLPLFWKIYGGIVLGFAVILIAGIVVLTSYLSAFENSRSVHFAEETFQKYFLTDSFEEALKTAHVPISPWEDVSGVSAALKEFCAGKELSFYSVGEKEGVAKYNVVAGTKDEESLTKIASLDFTQETEKGSFGFSGYVFSKMEIFFEPTHSAKVSIPSSYQLSVNGKKLEEKDAKEKSAHPWNAPLPKDVPGIDCLQFEFTDLYSEPHFSCTSPSGENIELQKNEETGVLEAPLLFQEVPETLSNRLMTGMKEYAKFIQADGSSGAVASYFDKSSLFYKNTVRNPFYFVIGHVGYAFENETIEDFYFFDENTLCCHISFLHVLKNRRSEDYIDPVDMTVFARKIGKEWYIFDRIVR